MPFFRGIEICVVASREAQKLPEYPHPDSASVRLRKAGTTVDNLANRRHLSPNSSTSPTASEAADPTRQKVNPRVSVYVPSLPGKQFYLRYQIHQSPPPSRCIFFKMIMNGRPITSWGLDTKSATTGAVHKSLCEVGERWMESLGGDVDVGAAGLETRYFHFMLGIDKKSSVGEDGGLIEVQVFRSAGRKRTATKPEVWASQERHGIASPSGGLLDNPQDATYYQYYLIDARDSPYATFCFHYKSIKYLEDLNLMPQPDARLRPASMNQCSPPVIPGRGTPGTDQVYPLARPFAFGVESLDAQVFDKEIRTVNIAVSEPCTAPKLEQYFLRSPPRLSAPSAAHASTVPRGKAPKDEITAEILQRPLPELPKSQSRRSSVSSLRSNCPSLTPSLKQYVESEDFENEDIRLSTAQPLLIPSESMQALELGKGSPGGEEGFSMSDYEMSPSSTETSQSPELPSPASYVPTTGSVLERQLIQFDSPVAHLSPRTGRTHLPASGSEATLLGNKDLNRSCTLHLTEAEWLRRTPSPAEGDSEADGELWSLRAERQTTELGANGGGAVLEGGVRTTECSDEGPVGNWI
ncbi:Uu.00g091630.m01.CDS01 [Anthostomella pinea]|uniref:Uu.00g091630.m01.CDS01 n=1 Tax=Anthostomella pinea TaxID=933095 RepID=A0AAI8VNT2_9PEZI|nr:Uu.00g091630.m01.CDS01 [Anthostomella pinea]